MAEKHQSRRPRSGGVRLRGKAWGVAAEKKPHTLAAAGTEFVAASPVLAKNLG